MKAEHKPAPVAWIVKHIADGPRSVPRMHFSRQSADAQVKQFTPGFARVVELVEREVDR